MRSRQLLAAGVLLGLVAAACGNSKSQTDPTTTTQAHSGSVTTANEADLTKFVASHEKGVDDAKKEIRVAVITSKTNPLGGKYVQYTDGVKAYFKMINDKGGIYGRKLVIAKERDDIIGTQNSQQVTASLSDDNAFATMVATLQFTGADLLAKAAQPTFIWNINPEMASTPTVPHTNIFGSLGALCFNCGGHFLPWLVTKQGYTKVGILAYGVSASSKICAAGTRKGYQLYTPNVKVAFFDDTIPFSGDLSADVAKMKSAGVQFVTTCMDTNEVTKLAKEMKKQGLNATQNLPNGYDHDSLKDPTTAALFENYFVEPLYVPLEDTPQSPATQQYLTDVKPITSHPVELTEVGYIMAKMFVDGLKGAGPEFTKQKVIDYLNTQTAYSAGGLIVPIDWTRQHNDPQRDASARGKRECATVTQIKSGKFVPLFTQPGKPWICFNADTKAPIPTEPEHVSFAPGGQG
jgi:ABC-type branched-subunit amino acid transport system substrate-binding protein